MTEITKEDSLNNLNYIFCLILDNKEESLFTCGGEGKILKINLSTKEINYFKGHTGEVWTLILDEENGVMYSTGHDYKVNLWCLRTYD